MNGRPLKLFRRKDPPRAETAQRKIRQVVSLQDVLVWHEPDRWSAQTKRTKTQTPTGQIIAKLFVALGHGGCGLEYLHHGKLWRGLCVT